MKTALRLGGIGMMLAGAALAAVFWFSGPKPSAGELTKNFYVKDKVISGAYKTYAAKDLPVPMWLAKTVFHNETGRKIKDLKVRYKLSEYADWCSWHTYAAVAPDQTVVDLYYPILSSSCAKLTSRAPAELRMEYEYTDQLGRKHQESDSRSVTMLDRHEFIFSDMTSDERTLAIGDEATYAYLLAAWVSRDDDAIARLASMADKKAGGLGATESDRNCLKVMAALYDIMRTIHISYQFPASVQDPSLSYDIKSVQEIQFPRDTVEKRSGTCIDLAILYAAMLHSIGIRPYLIVTEDHCFPVAHTPGGNIVAVEATGVGDGYNKSMTFEQAIESGAKTWETLNKSGRFVVVDVEKMWTAGVDNPELPPLPADILDRWGITKLVDAPEAVPAVAQAPGQQQVPAQQIPGVLPVQPPAEQPPAAPNPAPATVAGINGKWTYTVPVNGRPITGHIEIKGRGAQLRVIGSASYKLQGPDGRYHQFQERDECVGSLNGQSFSAQCNYVSTSMDGRQLPPQGLPLYLNLMLAPGGKSMQGQVVNSMGMTEPISMRR